MWQAMIKNCRNQLHARPGQTRRGAAQREGRLNVSLLVLLLLIPALYLLTLAQSQHGGLPGSGAERATGETAPATSASIPKPSGAAPTPQQAPKQGTSEAEEAQRPDYAELRQQVEAYLATRPGTYGVYFKDLISGAEWSLNGDLPIHAASTIKVPTVLYLNEQVAAGRMDWQDRVTYVPDSDWMQGAGALQFFGQAGEGYTLRTLANLSITLSDNIAHRMLVRHLGRDQIAAYMRSLGGQVVYPGGEPLTTARDMGRYLEGVLDFARRHPDLGRRLLDDLANTIWDVGMSGELPPTVTVAHKEGDVEGVANDVGIVYGSRPFILVVLSKDQPDLDEGFKTIAHVSRLAYDFQEALAGRSGQVGG